ncbi:serine/threonine-protein kinase RsbW [Desulfonauticus submarinus]|uniref:Serine/threonine-protein kinase RsbW n=1 Tax=Desulfonauticus submarinus TaxID=206665 RepID=A0A1G9ZQ16_9BACT|nr:ATP-binding protein [Desulfonauticus submarinus]SDN23320.1 serine/threonine-protein kinase RsbW [Desulfonauticus submarinus]
MEFILETNASSKEVRLVIVAVISILRRLVKEDVLYDVEIALSEACTNVVIHAYKGDIDSRDKKIRIKLEIDKKKGILLEVIDWGKQFILPQNLPDHDAESGRGIYIIRKVMDKFYYKRVEERNHILMYKKMEAEQWKMS